MKKSKKTKMYNVRVSVYSSEVRIRSENRRRISFTFPLLWTTVRSAVHVAQQVYTCWFRNLTRVWWIGKVANLSKKLILLSLALTPIACEKRRELLYAFFESFCGFFFNFVYPWFFFSFSFFSFVFYVYIFESGYYTK